MTETFSKSRTKAELAFNKEQSQFFARNQGVEENDAIAQARVEKTLRLRQQREAKEAEKEAIASADLSSNPTKRR